MKEKPNKIITGDCVDVLDSLPSDIVQLCVTSPPYPGQYGNKMNVVTWFAWISMVALKIKRVLADDGILALNVMFKRDGRQFDTRLFELPLLLKQHGFYFVDTYIYGKTNPAPNGLLGLCDSPAWEPVFVVAKNEDYYFRPYRQPYKVKSLASNGKVYTSRKSGVEPHPEGARQTNLMLLSSSGDQNRPKAKGMSFPLALPERFILQYTRLGDLVLDPFAGVGTTCRVAQRHGRSWLGIEMDEGEAEKARAWLQDPYQMLLIEDMNVPNNHLV